MRLVVVTLEDQEDQRACHEKLERVVQRSSSDVRLPHLKQRSAENYADIRSHDLYRGHRHAVTVLI